MNDDHAFDEPLRRALRAAADSVEPGADGLDQVWAKARALRAARPIRYGLAAAVRRVSLVLPYGQRPRAWLAAASRWIADAFRAGADQPGRLGWLRPAAVLATALFVATGTAWAVTTLPQVLTSAAGNRQNGPPGPGNGSTSPAVSSPTPGVAQGSGTPASQSGTPSPSSTCSNGSSIGMYSPTPSQSQSPSATPSPSPSPSPSGTASPSPTTSPSPRPSSASPGPSSPAPRQSATSASPTPTATPSQSASNSPQPCGG